MNKLRSEEALHDVTVIAMGSGLVKPETAARIRRQWTEDASDRKGQPVMSVEQGTIIANSIGIGVRCRKKI